MPQRVSPLTTVYEAGRPAGRTILSLVVGRKYSFPSNATLSRGPARRCFGAAASGAPPVAGAATGAPPAADGAAAGGVWVSGVGWASALPVRGATHTTSKALSSHLR